MPAGYPLRAIKRQVDAVLQCLSPLFDPLYEKPGRPSIPPEQLLKARVLTALYSERSERGFCEQLSYNLRWLWFMDREFREGSFHHSVFAKNYEHVFSADVARRFFAEVYFDPDPVRLQLKRRQWEKRTICAIARQTRSESIRKGAS